MKAIRCLAFLLICFAAVAGVSAQLDPTPEPTPIAAFTPDLEISLSDLGYDAISVRGAFGTSQIYLPIPLTWQTGSDAAVSLHIQSSPLLRDISSLTIYANSEPVASVALDGGGEITSDFVIPAHLIKSPGIQLRFEAYLRVTNDDCEDFNIPSQWVSVLGDSHLTWNFSRSPNCHSLKTCAIWFFRVGCSTDSIPFCSCCRMHHLKRRSKSPCARRRGWRRC